MVKRTTRTTSPKTRKSRSAKPSDVSMDDLRTYVRREAERFLEDPNITSIGIGMKKATGGKKEILCIQFTVNKKAEASQLEALGTKMIPEKLDVEGHDIPTDVIERNYRPSYHVIDVERKVERKRRIDPIQPGISVSHPDGTAGTFGAIVYDVQDGAPCILSNWHVLHGETGRPGDDTLQPGPFDDNQVWRNKTGTLVRSHLGLAGDCAIARIEGRSFEPEILELGVNIERIAEPELNDSVVKSGRTTGVTYGIVRRVDVVVKIDYGEGIGETLIGGFEIGPDEERPAKNNEISMGGDSGSVWVIADQQGKSTDIMVGLHFAGEGRGNPDEHALACYAKSVFNKLDISLAPIHIPPPDEEEDGFGNRHGYDEHFLMEPTPFPILMGTARSDAFMYRGSRQIHYTHFSLVMSKSRRFARCVAWNINGDKIKRLSRSGIRFRTDPRIDRDYQVDNDAYASNKLDRGHIARRADLIWGELAEAKRANRDSFYFTNITPQHERFNQSSKAGLWGMLENAIFEDVDVDDLKVTVFAGPIFKDRDLNYRGIKVPSDHWKLIAYMEGGTLKTKAFVLTQDDLLNDIEALELDEFRLWQISLADLAQLTSLDFGSLSTVDTMPERISGLEIIGVSGRLVREVTRREDLLK